VVAMGNPLLGDVVPPGYPRVNNGGYLAGIFD
jgi:hypothetical protein